MFLGGPRAVVFQQTGKIFPDNNILKLFPPPIDNFFGEKIFPDNNITIAFVAWMI
jgi:hypothetical protein